MKLAKPVKRWALGFRVTSKMNKSFNWIELANPQTFDTKEDAEKFTKENPTWNQHKNQNHTNVRLTCGPFELTSDEIAFYERQPSR